MPIATPQAYRQMIDTAKSQSFAFPAVNCVGSEAVNAALKGFADAGSDGIIQFSTGGAEFASGLGVKDMVTGAVALADFAHVVAQRYPVTVALPSPAHLIPRIGRQTRCAAKNLRHCLLPVNPPSPSSPGPSANPGSGSVSTRVPFRRKHRRDKKIRLQPCGRCR